MLTAAERETRFSMMGDEHGTWEVFTDDPMWVSRLDKIATAYKTNGEGKWYKIPANQIVIRKPTSEARKEASRKAGERGRAAQKAGFA